MALGGAGRGQREGGRGGGEGDKTDKTVCRSALVLSLLVFHPHMGLLYKPQTVGGALAGRWGKLYS